MKIGLNNCFIMLVFELLLFCNSVQAKTIDAKTGLTTYAFMENTSYRLEGMHDLGGAILMIPNNVKLRFVNGAGIKNGILLLSDGCEIHGGLFEFNYDDSFMNVYPGQDFHSPIIILNASEITIRGATFKYVSNGMICSPSISVYGADICCERVKIKDCSFYGSGVGFFSKVRYSSIENNIFQSSLHVASIETLYDERPYSAPSSIVFSDNVIDSEISGLRYPLIWISGVRNVAIMKNHFSTASDAIMLYCGDGNIALDNVFVTNNYFEIKPRKASDVDYKHCIIIRGKSYVYQTDYLTFGKNLLIEGNVFESRDKSQILNKPYNRAISINFATGVKINNNSVNGFSNFVVSFDTFKGVKIPCSEITVSNNAFTNISDSPFSIDSSVKSFIHADSIN